MAPRLAITLGDPSGIGPEVALKALAAELSADDTHYVLIGCRPLMQQLNERLQIGLDFAHTRLTVLDPEATAAGPLVDHCKPGSAIAAQAAVAWLEASAQLCLRGEVAGVVTAPVNKEAINRAGIPFIGQTEFFTERAGVNRTVMMLLGPDERERWLRVALATVHIALREVPVKLTFEKVLLAVERAAEACAQLGLARRRVAVCGLNPHAGEGGEFGDEEGRIIEPALQRARAMGLDVVGPLSGDTVFHQAIHGAYDAVVAMYHDQGLAPLKLAAFDNGVNWTLGLPFIRTSPDHGTAYDLVGRGKANPSSMIAALRLAKQLARNAPRR
jgi:4-hydroxythreonine-4-phosphate dehydrogenase